MTQEEKAKAYDEAIEKAKVFKEHLLEINDKDYADEMDYIFPELAESEDEKTRKALLQFLNAHIGCSIAPAFCTQDIIKWIAWVEKQGEHKPVRQALAKIGEDGRMDKSWHPTEKESKPTDNVDNLHQYLYGEQKPVIPLDENGEPILTEFESALFTTISYFWQSYNMGEEVSIAEFAKEYAPELLEAANKQQKPEWSEEDKRALNDAIVALSMYANGNIPNILPSQLLEDVEQLKSLRPQSQWKPSEEQMNNLEYISTHPSHIDYQNIEIIRLLYNDLKKLM